MARVFGSKEKIIDLTVFIGVLQSLVEVIELKKRKQEKDIIINERLMVIEVNRHLCMD